MWLIGAKLAGTAAKLGLQYAFRPKEKDYRPDLSYLDKYVANLRGDLTKRSIERNILREGARGIGDITRQQMAGAEHQAYRTGTVGTGTHIAQQQKIQSGAQRGMAEVTRQAREATAEQTERTQEQLREIELHREQVIEQAERDYDLAKRRHRQEMIATGAGGAIDVATAGVQRAMQWKDASAIAQADMPDEAIQEGVSARQLLRETGASTPSAALEALGIAQDKEQSSNFVRGMVGALGLASSPATQAIMGRIESGELTPQQGMQLIEATSEYKTTQALEGVLELGLDASGEEAIEYLQDHHPELGPAAQYQILGEYNKVKSMVRQEGLEEAYVDWYKHELGERDMPSHEKELFEAQKEARDLEGLSRQLATYQKKEGEERDRMQRQVHLDLQELARTGRIDHETIQAMGGRYDLSVPQIRTLQRDLTAYQEGEREDQLARLGGEVARGEAMGVVQLIESAIDDLIDASPDDTERLTSIKEGFEAFEKAMETGKIMDSGTLVDVQGKIFEAINSMENDEIIKTFGKIPDFGIIAGEEASVAERRRAARTFITNYIRELISKGVHDIGGRPGGVKPLPGDYEKTVKELLEAWGEK